MTRRYSTHREVIAGCSDCHGEDAKWFGGSAQGVAARHHDATGHSTWCDIAMTVRYGAQAIDDRQTDIEAAIAASSGDEPEAVPLPVPDAPTVPAAGVSAPESRPSRRDARRRRGARGQQPEAVSP